jgi:2-amino-4-hydroxy-6-hydroxymethyldihydropteridine diphosphokinase
MKNDVIVGLGSNIDPMQHIEQAILLIGKKFKGLSRSRLIKTAPLGFHDQDDFINGAIRFKTHLDIDALKVCLRDIEDTLGRVRTENKNGPRTIDLDILVWNGKLIDDDIPNRDFLKSSIEALYPGLVDEQSE